MGLLMACAAPDTEEESAASEDPAAAEVDDTRTIVNRHLESFGANDIEAVMADYADNAVLIVPDTTYTGKDAIRGAMEGFFPAFPTGQTELVIDQMTISGELGYIVWHATTPTLNVKLGTDTFITKEGKIQKQTFAALMEPVATGEEE